MKKLTLLVFFVVSAFTTSTLRAQAPTDYIVKKGSNRTQASPAKKWTDFPELYKKTLLIHAVEIGDAKTIEALCNDFDLDVSKLDRKKYSEQLIKDDLDIKKRIRSKSEKLNFGILGDNVEEEYRKKYRLSEYIIREAIQDKDVIISATVVAVFKNDYRSLDIILSGLQKLKSQVAISDFLNKTHINQNYTLLIMALLSYNPENAEDNIKTINVLLQYGANPKESSLIIDDKKVDVIQIAVKTQNIGALKYFKAIYLGLSQSKNFIAPILLEQRAGEKTEIINYVRQARELANTTSSPEIIEVLDDWIEIIDAKSSNENNLLNETSTHKIYDDDGTLAGTLTIHYSIEKSSGKVCNISVDNPMANPSTTKKIKTSIDINHFYSPNKRASYNSNSITEAFVSISWTATKLDGEIFGSSGVVKIDSEDPLNPKTIVVSSSRGRLE